MDEKKSRTHTTEPFDEKIDWLVIFKIILRRKRLLFRVVFLSSLAATGFVFYLLFISQPVYSAGACFYVADAVPAILNDNPAFDFYEGILRSRSTLDRIIDKVDLLNRLVANKQGSDRKLNREDARNILEKAVKIKKEKNNTFTIQTLLKDPELAVSITNAHVEALTEVLLRIDRQKKLAERTFLEKQIKSARQELAISENEQRLFSEEHGLVQLDSQTEAAIREIASYKKDIEKNDVELTSQREFHTDENPSNQMILSANRKLRDELEKATSGSNVSGTTLSAGMLAKNETAYISKIRNVKIKEEIYQELMKRYITTFKNDERSNSLVLLDLAAASIEREYLKTAGYFGAILAGGTFLACLLALLCEYWRLMPDKPRRQWEALRKDLVLLPWFRVGK